MATKYSTKQVARHKQEYYKLPAKLTEAKRGGYALQWYAPFTPRGKVYDLKGKR